MRNKLQMIIFHSGGFFSIPKYKNKVQDELYSFYELSFLFRYKGAKLEEEIATSRLMQCYFPLQKHLGGYKRNVWK